MAHIKQQNRATCSSLLIACWRMNGAAAPFSPSGEAEQPAQRGLNRKSGLPGEEVVAANLTSLPK